MEHLSQETIEKFVRGDYPYQKLLEISAHLFTCQDNCQRTLNQNYPDFLAEAQRLEDARTRRLANENHFSEAEIESYILKSFGVEKQLEMNSHFTKCRECSRRLKEKDPNYLSNFIKDNLNRNRESEVLTKEEEKGLFFRFLVPAAVFSLLIFISLMVIFMLPSNQPPDQAKAEEISLAPVAVNVGPNKSDDKNGKVTDNNKRITEANNTNNQTGQSKSEAPAKTLNLPVTQKQANQTKVNKSQVIIVKNRSLDKNCESNPSLAITPKDEVITDLQPELSWKPYPNAVGYKVYLSDTANNLVEKADITDVEKTIYKTTNKLELNKKYDWKVAATLKDGKEIYSESAYFSVGEKAKKLKSSKDKSKINEVRCLKSGN